MDRYLETNISSISRNVNAFWSRSAFAGAECPFEVGVAGVLSERGVEIMALKSRGSGGALVRHMSVMESRFCTS